MNREYPFNNSAFENSRPGREHRVSETCTSILQPSIFLPDRVASRCPGSSR